MTDSFRPDAAPWPERHALDARVTREGGPGARFATADERDVACARLAAESALVVRLEVEASARGRLSDVIDEAIEHELDARGAAPPGIGSASDADAALSDQLFRARRIGARGIGLVLGPLRAATSSRGAVEPEDSATLRFWANATHDRPVWLFLDAGDVTTGAYGDPIALAAVLLARSEPDTDATSETPEPVFATLADAPADSDADCALEDTFEPTPTDVIAVTVTVEAKGAPAAEAAPHRPVIALAEPPVPAAQVTHVALRMPPAPHAETIAEVPVAVPIVVPAAPVASPPLAARHTSGAAIAADDDAWRAWALTLSAARGPQPLAAFERLFARDYMPLSNAIAQGLDEPRALHAHEEFRRTFSRAYADACPTFAVTGKRPRMVFDAPEVAARIARLHGARATQILLLDGMRFDVGARVKESLRRALGARASLTDELILWSALPTTTSRQLETLQRGADALRSSQPDPERDVDPLRGRSSEVIRRIKVGSRDLYKLDVIEARVRDAGAQALAVLPEIADTAADAIARYAQTLKPRTLLFVFGDHGFTFDRGGIAKQGGSSPEEVLVPAFALLVGDVH